MCKESCLTFRELLSDGSEYGKFGGFCKVEGAIVVLSDTSIRRSSFGGDVVVFKVDKGSTALGDSGEELGEGSETDGESKVDMVVVGDESVE